MSKGLPTHLDTSRCQITADAAAAGHEKMKVRVSCPVAKIQ